MITQLAQQEQEYKETELGVLPKDWEVVKLGDYIDLETGKRMKGGALRKGGVLSIGGEHIGKSGRIILKSDMKYISEDFYHQLKQGKVKPFDILVVKDGATTGKIAYVQNISTEYMAINEHVFIIRSNDNKVLNQFLFYLLYSTEGQKEIRKNYHGIIGGIKREDINSIQIPLPPLPEQQKIAFVLSTIQEAGEKTENVINSLKELKKSLMKHLFTYGAVSFEDAEKVKLKDTEIGKVPEDWDVVKLGDVFHVQQGKQLSSKESTEGKIKIPFLRTSNVFWGKIDILNIDYMFFTEKEFEKLRLKNNDVLICEGGDIGRTAIWYDEINKCAYQNHLHRLRPIKDYSPQFMGLWMEHAIINKKMYIQNANRTTIPNLSSSRLKDFDLPKPPLPEQQQIASILSAVDEKIQAEENKKKAIDELFRSMLRNLMTAKVRVNDI